MNRQYRRACLTLAVGLLIVAGCKQKQESAVGPVEGGSPSENTATVAAMTRGMREISAKSLSRSHVGTQCVIVARAPEGGTRIAPPPPPIGMVCIMGAITVFKGELRAVSDDSIEIQAKYPGSGNVKTVPIERSQIQSVHLVP